MSTVDMEAKCRCGAIGTETFNTRRPEELHFHCEVCGSWRYEHVNRDPRTGGGNGVVFVKGKYGGRTTLGLSTSQIDRSIHKSLTKPRRDRRHRIRVQWHITRKLKPGQWKVLDVNQFGETRLQVLTSKRLTLQEQWMPWQSHEPSNAFRMPFRMADRNTKFGVDKARDVIRSNTRIAQNAARKLAEPDRLQGVLDELNAELPF